MRKRFLTVALLSCATAVCAEDFDGKVPMLCEPVHGHDCLPTETSCKPLKGEAGKDLTLRIDVANKKVKTPYRTSELPIQSVTNNAKSLVMQGTSLEFLWGATIHRTTGRLSIAIVDREGSYVIFGQCKLDKAAQAPK
jgi:hypothetical protein